MARGKQFSQLVSALRAELGRNNDPGVRASDLAQLQQAVKQVYEQEYAAYDWPHLRTVFDAISLAAGQRYYDFPDELDFDRLESVAVWHNNLPLEPDRGIGFEQYATYNSENDDRSDPVCRWDVRYSDENTAQIEVWPIPASNAQTLQFIGIRAYAELVDDDDVCRIDDQLVILKAAQRLDDNADRKKDRALAILRLEATLKGNAKAGGARVRIGLGRTNPMVQGKAVVRISASS